MASSRELIPLVDLARQHRAINTEIQHAISQVIGACEFIGGPRVEEFEQRFADYCAARHCVSLGNATDAITIALKALGIGAGDEVIVPAVSFFATAEAVSNAGATVVFCDIDPATANIDPLRIRQLIGPKTRAIVPVHLYGQPADMDAIVAIAHESGLRVIEDCAQAVGARYRNRRVGAIGDIGCFSFYPSKNLGAFGDGGAVVTNEAGLAEKCRMLANHGGLRRYEHLILGTNSRLDTLQAAVLTVKLQYLDDWNRQRADIAEQYAVALQNGPLEQLETLSHADHIYHLYTVRVDRRDEVRERLKAAGVDANVHYPSALPTLPPYAGEERNAAANFGEAVRHADRTLSVPIFPLMTKDEIEHVSRSLLRVTRELAR